MPDPDHVAHAWLRPTYDGCPHLAWAASGTMAITGDPDGPPGLAPAGLVPRVAAAGAALGALTARVGLAVELDTDLMLSGRAGLLGLGGRGRVSAGGATHLLPAGHGWCAVSLSRPDDVDLLAAMFPAQAPPGGEDPWSWLSRAVGGLESTTAADRVQLLGVPAAALPTAVPEGAAPWRATDIAPRREGVRLEGALVVDLSSLWAGPLCAQLLGRAGARVVKVESTRRPDGARAGERDFYDWLHAGHESVAVDFTSPEGRRALADLLRAADVVIEASRPRALAQLGLAPEELDHRAGSVWVSITGHGRGHPGRVALGDDAAVAGGLVAHTEDGPVFCGDAIADPLTGLVAALGVADALTRGGGVLLDVAMSEVAAVFAGPLAPDHGEHPVRRTAEGWVVDCPLLDRSQPVLPPRRPVPAGRAPALGVDTARVLGELAAAVS